MIGKAGVCRLKQAIDSGIASSADGSGEPRFITKDTKEEGTKDTKGAEGLRLPKGDAFDLKAGKGPRKEGRGAGPSVFFVPSS